MISLSWAFSSRIEHRGVLIAACFPYRDENPAESCAESNETRSTCQAWLADAFFWI